MFHHKQRSKAYHTYTTIPAPVDHSRYSFEIIPIIPPEVSCNLLLLLLQSFQWRQYRCCALLTFLSFNFFSSPLFPSLFFFQLPFLILLLLLLLLQHFLQDCQVFHPRSLPIKQIFSFISHHSLVESNTFLCSSNSGNLKSLLFRYLITIRANRQPLRHVSSSINSSLCHPPHHTRKLNIMSRSQPRSCSRPSGAFVQALHHPHGLRPLHDPIPTPKQRLYH